MRSPAKRVGAGASLATVASLVAALGGNAGAQVAPVGAHHVTLGAGAGGQVSPTGGLSMAVPIELPGARGGVPVPFSINYTGSARVGAAGAGWDIPVGYVRVSTSTMRRKPTLSNVSANGQIDNRVDAPQRIVVSVGSGATTMVQRAGDANTYIPGAGDHYMELTRLGASWELRDTSGLIYTFSSMASLDTPSDAERTNDPNLWLLTQVRDRAGRDRVELQYAVHGLGCASGSVRGTETNLVGLRYFVNAAGAPLYSVALSYAPWTDAHPSTPCSTVGGVPTGVVANVADEAGASARVSLARRVVVNARNNLAPGDTKQLRAYNLSYVQDADTGMPRLSAVDVEGEAGPDMASRPVVRYAYGAIVTQAGGLPQPAVTFGAAMTVSFASSIPNAFRSSLSSTQVDVDHTTPLFGHDTRQEHITTQHVLRDFTGDGLPDLVYKTGGRWNLVPGRLTGAGFALDAGTYTWADFPDIQFQRRDHALQR